MGIVESALHVIETLFMDIEYIDDAFTILRSLTLGF
jgi:hypothetical protein